MVCKASPGHSSFSTAFQGNESTRLCVLPRRRWLVQRAGNAVTYEQRFEVKNTHYQSALCMLHFTL